MNSDLMLQQDVIAGLNREPTVDATGIGVEVHHGVVKLAGRISSSLRKWNADRVARQVHGVTAVVVDIDVTLERASIPTEDDIAPSVQNVRPWPTDTSLDPAHKILDTP